jgi:hypothetical protein
MSARTQHVQRACNPLSPTLGTSPLGTAREQGDDTMCLTCGCMDAHADMGEANITYDDIERAAKNNGRSVEETMRTFEATADKDRREHRDEYLVHRPTA